MPGFRGPRGGHQNVVNGLVDIGIGDILAGGFDGSTDERLVQDGIDLIESEPVLHAALVSVENSPRILFVEVNELAVFPPAIGTCQVEGCFVMGKSD